MLSGGTGAIMDAARAAPRQLRRCAGAPAGVRHRIIPVWRRSYHSTSCTGGGSSGGGGRRVRPSATGGQGPPGDGGKGKSFWASYNSLLESNPLLTKAATTAAISAIGNAFCQLFIEAGATFDWQRFWTFTGLGFVFVAPVLHTWYGTLNSLVPGGGTQGALVRMALDQLGCAPIFIAAMMALIALCDGSGASGVAASIKSSWADAVRANWMLWVPVQFLNFRFVPVAYQLLVANCTALVWNVYLSFVTRGQAA